MKIGGSETTVEGSATVTRIARNLTALVFGGSPRIYAGEERSSAPKTAAFTMRFSAGIFESDSRITTRGSSQHYYLRLRRNQFQLLPSLLRQITIRKLRLNLGIKFSRFGKILSLPVMICKSHQSHRLRNKHRRMRH